MTRDEQRTLDGLAATMDTRLNAQDVILADLSLRMRTVELDAARAAGVSAVLKGIAAVLGSGLLGTLMILAYYLAHG